MSAQHHWLEVRWIRVDGKRSTLSLEPTFWEQIEKQAEQSGRSVLQWVEETLQGNRDKARARSGYMRAKLMELVTS